MNIDFKSENLWLMQGDCIERMKEIPDNSIDVVISDIPYGIDYNHWDITHTNKNSALLGASPAQKQNKLFKTRGKPKNGWSLEDKKRPLEFQNFCSQWLKEIYRITKPCSPLLIMTGRQNQHRFTVAAEDTGFIFKDYIIWDKCNAPFRAQNINKVLKSRGLQEVTGEYRLGSLAPVAEPIVWMFKPYKTGSTITDNFLDTGLGCFESSSLKKNIITLNSYIEDRFHETQKPVELMTLLIETFSMKNHTVLDMFLGSGTTGVACVNAGRKFIGIELDERYFNIAKDRIMGSLQNS